MQVPLNVASRLLPYVLLLFVGVAGWSMNSTALLAVVVVGIVAVAIGTSVTTKQLTSERNSPENRPLI